MQTLAARSVCHFLLSISLLWNTAHAADPSYWLLGAIGLVETTRLDAGKLDSNLVPYIAWESGGLHIGIDELSYEFGRRDDFKWTILGIPRYALDSESPRFEALERDFALEVGGELAVSFYPWVATAKLLTDASATHNGQLAELAFGQAIPLGPGEYEFEFGVQYQSEDLAMHLYGISDQEATSMLPAYNPGSVWKGFVAASYFVELGERAGVQCQIEISDLSGDVANSERISNTFQAEAYIAFIRQF